MELALEKIGDVAVSAVPVEELDASNAGEFKRDIAPVDGPAESRFVRGYRRALMHTVRYRYAFVTLSAALLLGAAIVMAGGWIALALFSHARVPDVAPGTVAGSVTVPQDSERARDPRRLPP